MVCVKRLHHCRCGSWRGSSLAEQRWRNPFQPVRAGVRAVIVCSQNGAICYSRTGGCPQETLSVAAELRPLGPPDSCQWTPCVPVAFEHLRLA